MKILHFTDAKPVVLTEDTALNITGRMVIGKAIGAKQICMQVFELLEKGCTPWYFYEHEHQIFIFSGTGEVLIDGSWIPVSAGYVLFVPEYEEHQIRNRGDEPLVVVSLTPMEAVDSD